MATPDVPTMNGASSRHMACKLCRDRKVRCGGEQPVCEKCRLAGEPCVYLPTHKSTKADLVQMVEALQKRLDETETYLSQLKASTPGSTTSNHNSNNNSTHGFLPSSSSSTSYHSSQWHGLSSTSANGDQQDAQTFLSSSASDQQTPSSATTSGDGTGGSNCSSTRNNATATTTNGCTSSASKDVYFPRDPIPGFQDPPPNSSQPLPPLTPFDFPVTDNEPMNLDFYAPAEHDPFNADAFSFPHAASPAATLLAPLTTFTSTLLNTQAEATVIALVVADYIAWLRTSPLVAGLADQAPVFLGMLTTLEDRLRELVERQSHGSRVAVNDLGAVLRDMGMGSCVEGLEDRLLGEARERGHAFRARFNPCAVLSEQHRREL
ncbi:unnamed protein product [Discula destructiva]